MSGPLSGLTVIELAGLGPAPSPRFSRTPAAVPSPTPRPGEHTDEVLRSCGLSAYRVASLREAGVVA